jgi:hypothetical protein
MRDELARCACLTKLDGCGARMGQEAEDRAAIGRYRLAFGRRDREPLAVAARRDQQQSDAHASRGGCSNCSKCSKLADPRGMLCKLNELNMARACLRRVRWCLIARLWMNGASVGANFFRYREPSTGQAIAGSARAGGSNNLRAQGRLTPEN